LHTKSYQKHLRDAKYCGSEWRILTLKPLCNEQLTASLPKIRVIRVRCNSKACPRCQLAYYRKIRKQLRYSTITGQWRMFTLTGIHHQGEEAADLHRLEANFRELRKKLKRKFPNFQYFAVKELSPNGNWHYHGLWNIYINFSDLVKYWKEISGAHRVWLSQVRYPLAAVNYIFKYCFKSINSETERRLLYECDKRKFSSSKGLLSRHKGENPYTSEYGTTYGVEDLKEKLYSIISHSDLTLDDFNSVDYPYFEDLMINLFYRLEQEHPPDLFSTQFF
jgi:hypothetical protein